MKEGIKLYFCILFVVVISLFLGGCASKFTNILPPDDFLQKKDVTVGLIWASQTNTNYPEGPGYTAKHYRLGAQGLLDIAINRAFADQLVTKLGEIKLEDLMQEHYFSVFQKAFENNNFKVKINLKPYCFKKFNLSTNEYCTNALDVKNVEDKKVGDGLNQTSVKAAVLNYKPVIADLGVDYLLVIDLIMQGTGRSYYGFIPTSPPKGITTLISYLIDGRTEEIISQHMSSVVEPVKGEWDEPPEYANLMTAVRASFDIAIDEVFIDIFKQAP